MRPPRFSLLLAPVVVFFSLVVVPGVGLALEGVERVSASQRGVTFRLLAPEGTVRVVTREGEPPALEIEGLGSVLSESGWQLPMRTVWVGLPPEATVELRVRSSDRAPLRLDAAGKQPPPVEAFPSVSVEIGRASWLRNQRVVPVSWTPVLRGGGGPIWERSVEIELRFTGTGRGGSPPQGEDRWESVYRSLLVNYETARSWRRSVVRRPRRQGDFFSTTSNPWLRLGVEHPGLYAVTGSDLQAVQIDLSSITDPETTLRLYTGRGTSLPETVPVTELPGWLGQVAIRLEGFEDGSFDPQDRILFRALGPDGWYADYGQPDALYERYRTDEFSNANTYWLGWGPFEEPALRWTEADGQPVPTPRRTKAPHRIHYEENEFWDPHPWEVLTGAEYQNPDSLPAWEKWHWLEVIATSSGRRSSVAFRVPSPEPTEPARLTTRLWGSTDNLSSSMPDHYITIDLRGDSVAAATWNQRDHIDVVAEGLVLDGEEQELGLTAPYIEDTLGYRVDRSYLAWFELDYVRRLEWKGEDLEFRVEPGSARIGYEVGGIDDTSTIVVLDVTDPLRTVQILPAFEPEESGFAALFGVDADPERYRQILLADRASVRSPEIVRDTPPPGGYLRERTDAVDYILITHASSLEAAARLAAWRQVHGPEGEGLRVAVVDVQDVYDEFSAGRVDPTAIRNFLHHAFLNWNGGDPAEAPSYVCLIGDGTFDFRNRRGQRGDLIVPTYEGYFVPGLIRSIYSPHFGSDDWLVLFDEPPDPTLDIAIGRLPADSPASAEALVDKVIAYESTLARDNWRQRFTLVADDVCQGLSDDAPLYFTHTRQTEELLDEILPGELEPDRVYLYEFGTECVYDRKPDAAAALRASIERGALVINYTGHGSEEQLADERVLETADVASMTNSDRLFFFLTASCSVGKFDFDGEGLGEALVRQPEGGAIGIFSATAVAFSGSNAQLNRAFFRAAFPDSDVLRSRPLGEVAVVAKGSVPRPERVGNRRYPLLMEPVIRLGTPSLRVRLFLEGTDTTGVAVADTIYRGAPVIVRGEVLDSLGNLQEGFDGKVDFQIYDSEIVREAQIQFSRVEYNLTGAPIFRGSASVAGGLFEAQLIAPAALRRGERGSAQFFAWGLSDEGTMAIGGRAGIGVPETQPPQNIDQEGPEIELSVDGDLESLSFDARWEATLVDSSGINITQLVPARSVRLRIEEGTRLVHLEDLAPAVSFPEDYRVGRLEFTLPEDLEGGRRYQLTLEAFDNLDHQGSSSVEFLLAASGADQLSLGRVYNVPNPMEEATTFFFEISQETDVTIRIFTVSGKRVREIRSPQVTPAQAASTGIYWEGLDEDGDRLANGVYFYKVSVRGVGGARASRIERLAVLR